MTRSIVRAAAALLALAAAAAQAQAPAGVPLRVAVTGAGDAPWAIRKPLQDPVLFQGLAAFDEAGGGTGAMLYPAPNAAGLLIAILTHAAINETAKAAEKARIQEAANKVIEPYAGLLQELQHQPLLEAAVAAFDAGAAHRLVEPQDAPAGHWLVDIAPGFALTQDQRAIILENAITVHSLAEPRLPVYRNVVRVALRPRAEEDPAQYWQADGGARLRAAAAALLAESLGVARRDFLQPAADDPAAMKTVRYLEGGKQRIERAAVLGEHCGRLLLRTLRGWLKSVPAAAFTPTADCAADPLGPPPLAATPVTAPGAAPPTAPAAAPAADPAAAPPAAPAAG